MAATIEEGDELAGDNSPGRLPALSAGVFAIAMTLLALDRRLVALAGLTLLRLAAHTRARGLKEVERKQLWGDRLPRLRRHG
jgi:hypothetical protein